MKQTDFSRRFASLRKAKGFSQKDIAERIGLTPRSVSAYENGDREPTIETLVKLAELFDCSLDYLCGVKEKDLPEEGKPLTVDEVYEFLVRHKFVSPGKDLSDRDLDFLLHILEMIGKQFGD